MSRIGTRLIGVSLLFGLTVSFASAAEYTLMPNPQTVHVGYFSAALSGPCEIIDASGLVPPSAVPASGTHR
jgi:hypothetical protein